MVDEATTQVNVKNTSPARQGISTAEGNVWLKPGEGRDVVVTERQMERLKRLSFLDIDGFRRSSTLGERNAEMGSTTSSSNQEFDDLRQQFDDLTIQHSEVTTQLGAANSRVEELEGQLKTATEELEKLNNLETSFADKLRQVMTSNGSPLEGRSLVGITAKHKGGGSYSVVNDKSEDVVEKLTKEQSDAFNGMSEVDRLVWIDEQYTPPKQADQE